MRPDRALLTFVLAMIAVSCTSSDRPSGSDPAPVLVIADSAELKDPSSGPIGTPGDLVSLRNGGYLIVDTQNSRLLEYDARGNFARSIGHKGGGPGEFQSVGSVALDADSVLYALEPMVMNVFDFRTGAFRRKAQLPAPFGSSIAARNANIYFRTIDAAQLPNMSSWRNDTIKPGPKLPAASELETVKSAGVVEFAKSMNTTHSFAVFSALHGDTIAVLSQSSESILLATPARIITEIPVARTQRQGVRADLIARIASDPSIVQKEPQVLYTPSIPYIVARGASGNFYSVKSDFTFLGKRFAAKLFLSVTDPRTGLTCPDARIPGSDDPRPAVALRGDTLIVLSQEIRGTAAVTMIRKYLVQTRSCKWIKPTAP